MKPARSGTAGGWNPRGERREIHHQQIRCPVCHAVYCPICQPGHMDRHKPRIIHDPPIGSWSTPLMRASHMTAQGAKKVKGVTRA